MNQNKEYILCSAIWYKDLKPIIKHPSLELQNIEKGVVICGHRHPNCIAIINALTGKRNVTSEVGEYEQGFLTNKNRFVDRKKAAIIAYNAGQVNDRVRWYEMTDQDWKTRQLFSEDLY